MIKFIFPPHFLILMIHGVNNVKMNGLEKERSFQKEATGDTWCLPNSLSTNLYTSMVASANNRTWAKLQALLLS